MFSAANHQLSAAQMQSYVAIVSIASSSVSEQKIISYQYDLDALTASIAGLQAAREADGLDGKQYAKAVAPFFEQSSEINKQCGRRHESTRSTKFDTSQYYSIDLYRFVPIVYLLNTNHFLICIDY
jgi:GH43 family beta-xylosidase